MKEADLPEQVQQLLATLRMASDVGGEIAKVAAYISVPITTYFMIRYLSAVSAPFPIGMSSSPALLGVLATAFCIVFVSLTSTMAWIVWQAIPFRWARLRREAPHLRSHVIRFRFPRPVKTRTRSRRRAFSRTRLQFIGAAYLDYLLVYLPFIALWICIAIGAIIDWHPSSSRPLLVVTLGSLLAGTTASFGLIQWLRPDAPAGSPSESRWYRMTMFALLGLSESAITIVMVIFFLAITDVIGQPGSEKSFGIVVLVTILVIHMSANISRFEPITTVSMWVVISLLVVSLPLGVSMYGATTVRLLAEQIQFVIVCRIFRTVGCLQNN